MGIVASLSIDPQRKVSTTLGALSETVAAQGTKGPAILMLRYLKSLAPGAASYETAVQGS